MTGIPMRGGLAVYAEEDVTEAGLVTYTRPTDVAGRYSSNMVLTFVEQRFQNGLIEVWVLVTENTISIKEASAS
ncbi:MAG: hypothetical protein U5K28_04905 [Halobacteriales archaeon]|nr:hypothetical protein [Halobacteriales archaeon]